MNRKEGSPVLFVRPGPELRTRLERQLGRSRRTVNAEVVLALEAWLERQEREAKGRKVR
jgi:hypothetical protein